MKRYIALIAAVLCLASCGSVDSSSSDDKTPADTSSSIAVPDSSVQESEPTASQADSKEEYPEDYSLEIKNADAPQVKSVSLKVTEPDGLCKLENVYKTDILATDTTGLVGCPVNVELNAKLGELSFAVDTDKLGDMPFENLAVLKTGQGKSFESIPFRADGSSIVCDITESDTYMLVDLYQWQSAWSGDVTGTAHETEFSVPEYGFKLTLPKGVAPSAVSDSWEETDFGAGYLMTKELMFQNKQKTADIQAELLAYRYPNEEDGVDDPQPYISFDDRLKNINTFQNDAMKVDSCEIWELGDGRRGLVAVFHFPGDDSVKEQTNINAQFEYSEDTYIVFNMAFNGHDKDTIDRCLKSVKSFVYTDKTKE